MDPYYASSPSYYYPSACPLHESSSPFLSDSYADPYSTYPSSSTSYYYPSYNDQIRSPMVFYSNTTANNNNSITSTYAQTTYPIAQTHAQISPVNQQAPTGISTLNTTFELAPPAGRRRRQRTIFSKDQVDILDQVFEKNQYPDIQLREQLSERLDVPEARIQVWFKNRRSRARTTTTNKLQY